MSNTNLCIPPLSLWSIISKDMINGSILMDSVIIFPSTVTGISSDCAYAKLVTTTSVSITDKIIVNIFFKNYIDLTFTQKFYLKQSSWIFDLSIISVLLDFLSKESGLIQLMVRYIS